MFSTSCNNWLDVTPQGQIEAEDLYETTKGCNSAVGGIYYTFSGTNLFGQTLSYGMLDIFAQYWDFAANTTHMYYQASQYDFTDQTVVGTFENVWGDLYYAIAQCNAFIEYSEPYRDNIDNYNLLLGEVYGLRALAHMELFEIFGPVIHTKADLQKDAIAYRTAYNNIRKVSYMLLSCGLAEVLFFILSIIFNLPMPLVAIQLLWLNIVTDGLQDFALSFEKTEPGTMMEKPRSTKETIFNKELFAEVLVAGITIGLIVFGIWYYLVNVANMEIHLARGYIMVLMVFLQNMHVLNCRSEKTSIFKMPFNNPLVIVTIIGAIILQVIVMEVPFLSEFLNTTTVPIVDMLKLFVFSLIIILVMEIFKVIKNKIRKGSVRNSV